MTLKADKDGFLVGVPLRADDSVRLLGAIKGDTGKILAAMYGRGRTGASQTPTATPVLRNPRAAALASGATSAGGGRPLRMSTDLAAVAAVGRARGPGGRFVAAGGSGAAANQRLAQVAAASTAMARTAELQRRQDKADRQARGADRRFGSGDRARRGELAGSLRAGAGHRCGASAPGMPDPDCHRGRRAGCWLTERRGRRACRPRPSIRRPTARP